MAKVVTFFFLFSTSVAIGDNEDNGGEFCKITSEGELYETSDEEDAEFLQLALESAYACSPLKSAREQAELSSYLLLDKDLMH